jgi:hypothetical protein
MDREAAIIEALPDGVFIKNRRYCLRIETPTHTHTCSVPYGMEISNWMRILRRGMKTARETGRTWDTKLRKNIDKLVFMHRQRDAAGVDAYIDSEFNYFIEHLRYDKTKPYVLLKNMANAQLNSFDVRKDRLS